MEGTNIVKLPISPLLLLTFTLVASAASPTNFIRTSCKAASYPGICVTSLTSYARSIRHSPRQLAHVSLSVSASRAGDASNYLSSVSAKSVRTSRSSGSSFEDCAVAMAHSADRLRKSVRELSRMGRAGSRRFVRRVSNVQTWVSAALTDQNACLGSLPADGGAGGSGSAVRKKVVEASRMTSNALSFVNGIA